MGIYRAANVDQVARRRPGAAGGWTSRLVGARLRGPTLADVTVGDGPGEKPRSSTERSSARGLRRWVVLRDDDIAFRRGDVVELVGLRSRGLRYRAARPRARFAREPRASPARCAGLARAPSRSSRAARSSVVAPEWCERMLPLPDWRGMGWGLELEWMDLRAEGCLLGVVDATRSPPRRGWDDLRRDRRAGAHESGARRARHRRSLARAVDARRLAPLAQASTVARATSPLKPADGHRRRLSSGTGSVDRSTERPAISTAARSDVYVSRS